MKQTVEMLSIDNRTIAQLLKKMQNDPLPKNKRPNINKMMHNISWIIGNEPEMILNGKVSKCDVVAESILELPFIYADLECIIVEISDKTTQYLGFVFIYEKKIVASQISCYNFIDWINEQQIANDRVSGIHVANAGDGVVHIKIILSV